ncbi:hypothetical protein [Azoarcus sp. KH32C]|uniref:hypothetical protein n=1 Tax=Azoarcus sp. KH32C TaxID=748247 RepID=UPI0002386DF9|nr:hypothetical protein [Azoarcus sp. KH32C]BAL26046.1 hypothetical protein AZKH_3762 [Azoarcus sp. KH32C]
MSHQSPSALGSLANDDYDLFPELATTLYCWVERLYQTVVAKRIEQVFFLSREGQPLKRMFDAYCARMGVSVESLYLEVSRRSTLLPSLSALGSEQFETLFRQYRRMSLLEFLSSLGLEGHCGAFVEALGLPAGAEERREDDFPTSALFQRLKTLPLFVDIFETERLGRRDVFIRYLTDLAGGALPERLVIVDVGWKGTIQDNLFALLCKAGDLPVKSVEGYYVGLVASGATRPNNIKQGLLFSCVGERSPHFHVFNENRALFEVILAADHGSVVSYEFDMPGRACPVRGPFEEEAMLVREVFPVLRLLFARFNELLLRVEGANSLQFRDVVKAHARMVFNPTRREMAWFSSVFHVENYGVFERSHFGCDGQPPGPIDRLKFLIGLRRRGLGALGFWPWRTLHERGGALTAAAYAMIRQAQ